MTITICIGSSCHLKGSRTIIQKLEELITEHQLNDKIELNGSFCMGECSNGVCVKINDELFSVSPETVNTFFENEVHSLPSNHEQIYGFKTDLYRTGKLSGLL